MKNAKENTIENRAHYLISSAAGKYIPQFFYEIYHPVLIGQLLGGPINIETNVDPETWEALKDPEGETYWDAWSEVLDKTVIHSEGEKWTLIQNEDLWAIPESCIDQIEAWMI